MHEWKRNLLVSWIAQFFSIMGFAFAIPFAPFYLQALGVTEPAQLSLWSGFFASGAGLSMALVTPLWGYLADRIGKKPMTLRASLGGAVTLLGMGLAHSPEMLLLCRVLQGFFTGTVTAYLTLVVSETPRERVGFAIGVMNSAVFLGNSIAPLLGGVFADLFGFRTSFFVAAGLLFASFLMSVFFVHEQFTPITNRSFSFFADSKHLLLYSGVAPIVGMFFLYGISRSLERPVLPLFVQDLVSVTSSAASGLGVATQAGFVTSAAGLAAVLAGMLIGALADRGNVIKLGVVCGVGGSASIIMVVLASRVWHLTLIYFLSAFFIGGIDPILKVIVTRIVPEETRGSAFGIIGSARSLGWFTGSLSGGACAAFFGLRSVFVVLSVLFSMIAAFLTMFGKRKSTAASPADNRKCVEKVS